MRRAAFLLAVMAFGCGGDATVDPDGGRPAALTTDQGVEYSAETLIMESFPVQLRTVVTVKNVGDSSVRLSFPDGCVVLLRAYREGSSAAAWDQGNTVMCTGAFVEVDLAPGATRTFETSTDAAAILGDTLPDGRYRLVAYLRPTSGEVALDAGSADLAIHR